MKWTRKIIILEPFSQLWDPNTTLLRELRHMLCKIDNEEQNLSIYHPHLLYLTNTVYKQWLDYEQRSWAATLHTQATAILARQSSWCLRDLTSSGLIFCLKVWIHIICLLLGRRISHPKLFGFMAAVGVFNSLSYSLWRCEGRMLKGLWALFLITAVVNSRLTFYSCSRFLLALYLHNVVYPDIQKLVKKLPHAQCC